MAAPITPVSPLPAVGFSVTLTAATDTDISPGLYANTTEVQIYNPDDADDLWIAFAPNVSTRAFVDIGETLDADLAPYVGDTVTLDGNVLTAAGGPFVAGTNTFSVDVRAEGEIEVIAGSIPVGSTISLISKKGPPDQLVTLTCIAGVRAAGSLTFQSLAGTAAQAAEISAAINDSAWSPELVRSSSVVGSTITCIAGNNVEKRGANGNSIRLIPTKATGLGFKTSAPTFVTLTAFTGGINADGQQTTQDGTVLVNQPRDYLQNLLRAIIDPANATAAVFSGGQLLPNAPATIRIWAATAGVGGNALVVTTSAGTIFTPISSPSAGGVTYPAALTAATAIVVGPGERVVLPVGREGERSPIQPAAFWTTMPGANLGLIGRVATGGNIDVNITYVNRT